MLYKIEALDVLFFRDARPFSAGQNHLASSEFPPSPMTVQGMVRSNILSAALSVRGAKFEEYLYSDNDSMRQLRQLLGDGGSSFGKLRIQGPFLFKQQERGATGELWFRVPLDVTQVNDPPNTTIDLLQPASEERIVRQWSIGRSMAPSASRQLAPLIRENQGGTESEPPSFSAVPGSVLQRMLCGEVDIFAEDATWEELFSTEYRVGIERTAGRVSESGMLYTAQVVRPSSGVSLLVEVSYADDAEGPTLDSGVVRLGGDGHLAKVRRLEESDTAVPAMAELTSGWIAEQARAAVIANNGRFKLYLATPAILTNGWIPDWVNRDSLQATVAGVPCRLVSAAVGKPGYVGGWDIVNKRPKPLYPAVPAGSVFFFEPVSDLGSDLDRFTNELFESHHVQPISNANGQFTSAQPGEVGIHELSKIGFGIALVGSWHYV